MDSTKNRGVLVGQNCADFLQILIGNDAISIHFPERRDACLEQNLVLELLRRHLDVPREVGFPYRMAA